MVVVAVVVLDTRAGKRVKRPSGLGVRGVRVVLRPIRVQPTLSLQHLSKLELSKLLPWYHCMTLTVHGLPRGGGNQGG